MLNQKSRFSQYQLSRLAGRFDLVFHPKIPSAVWFQVTQSFDLVSNGQFNQHFDIEVAGLPSLMN